MIRGLFALWLASPPTIAVDVTALDLPQAQAEQLHGELMTRLVEEGHAVGATGAVVLRLTGGGNVVHVELQHGRDTSVRDVTGEGALLRLATIHAAIELLAQEEAIDVEPDPVLPAPRDRSVALEVAEASEPHAAAAMVAIVDSGNVVTPDAASASLKVCLSEAEGLPTIAVVPATSQCRAGTPSRDLGEDLPRALADARARSKQEDSRRDPKRSEARPAKAEPAPTKHEPSRSTVRWSGALGIGLGVQARIRPVEPLVSLRGDARHATGALITARLELAPSREGSLGVVDTFLTGGGGWRFAPHPRVRLELAATLGIALHNWRLAGDRGTSTDFTAELPLALGVVLGRRFELGFAPLVGVSTRTRVHYTGMSRSWARDRWRIAGLVTLSIALDGKLRGAR